MATRKTTKKKSTGAKKSKAGKPLKRAQKWLPRGKTVSEKAAGGKKAQAKTKAKKSIPAKTVARKKAQTKTKGSEAIPRARRNKGQQLDLPEPSPNPLGLESGDLEGLSNEESADSESVDELLEEGNAFEAGLVSGVEDSRGREGKEVRTREVPEDDVPQEYLDED